MGAAAAVVRAGGPHGVGGLRISVGGGPLGGICIVFAGNRGPYTIGLVQLANGLGFLLLEHPGNFSDIYDETELTWSRAGPFHPSLGTDLFEDRMVWNTNGITAFAFYCWSRGWP